MGHILVVSCTSTDGYHPDNTTLIIIAITPANVFISLQILANSGSTITIKVLRTRISTPSPNSGWTVLDLDHLVQSVVSHQINTIVATPPATPASKTPSSPRSVGNLLMSLKSARARSCPIGVRSLRASAVGNPAREL